jgi:hypothetical protein
MQGWLVKKEEEGVKEEEGHSAGVVGAGGTETGEEVKKKGRTLVVMGTYSIGKERIVKGESNRGGTRQVWAVLNLIAVAKAIGSKIYCDPRKRGILMCQTDNELHDLLSDNPVEVSEVQELSTLPLVGHFAQADRPSSARSTSCPWVTSSSTVSSHTSTVSIRTLIVSSASDRLDGHIPLRRGRTCSPM